MVLQLRRRLSKLPRRYLADLFSKDRSLRM